MVADLEAIVPSAIVAVLFLAGVIALVRHELAPKRGASKDGASREDREPTEL